MVWVYKAERLIVVNEFIKKEKGGRFHNNPRKRGQHATVDHKCMQNSDTTTHHIIVMASRG